MFEINSMDKMVKSVNDLVCKGKFHKYIHYIDFPYFKNMKPNERIEFDFPMTVLVGKNGSGKSSSLHALFGAPEGYTITDFWFSTAVDPIEETRDEGNRHCYYYGFKDSSSEDIKEVLYTRIKNPKHADYWETSRPVKKYGMVSRKDDSDKTRNSPISKNLIYLDFRAELSSFDKFMYFGDTKKLRTKSKRKQDYLRSKSVNLKSVLDNPQIYMTGGRAQNELPEILNKDQVDAISWIAGKSYKSIKIIRHKFFDDWGYSVILETDSTMYSEAHAGSGEIAVVKLVYELHNAPPFSLVLLDEPEVSLHPGAQRRLKQYLLGEVCKMKHQVVISTHAPAIVEGLPKSAIKIFRQCPTTNRFTVTSDCFAHEAFFHLEECISSRPLIVTEDYLSKRIIERVALKMGLSALIDVQYFPGGADTIKTSYSPFFATTSPNTFIVFDGDQKPVVEPFAPGDLTEKDRNEKRLDEIISSQIGHCIDFPADGNSSSGHRIDQKINSQINYIRYLYNNVKYLPQDIPERIILDHETLKTLVGPERYTSHLEPSEGSIDPKTFIWLAANAYYEVESVTDSDLKSFHEVLTAKWLNNKNKDFEHISITIKEILGSFEKSNPQ